MCILLVIRKLLSSLYQFIELVVCVKALDRSRAPPCMTLKSVTLWKSCAFGLRPVSVGEKASVFSTPMTSHLLTPMAHHGIWRIFFPVTCCFTIRCIIRTCGPSFSQSFDLFFQQQYISPSDIRKRLTEYLAAPKALFMVRDPEDPSGIFI